MDQAVLFLLSRQNAGSTRSNALPDDQSITAGDRTEWARSERDEGGRCFGCVLCFVFCVVLFGREMLNYVQKDFSAAS